MQGHIYRLSVLLTLRTWYHDATLDILTSMKIEVVVFWVVTPCSDVVQYLSGDGGSLVPRNFGILPFHYTAPNPEDHDLNVSAFSQPCIQDTDPHSLCEFLDNGST